jgi:hypothetical protein
MGRAVFYIEGNSVSVQFNLPCCGFQLLEDGSEQPVVIVQAEQTSEGIFLGVRPLGGGNAVCMEAEVRLLPKGFQS